MQRREFVKFFATTATLSSAGRALAQQRVWRIGWLDQSPPPPNDGGGLASFQRGGLDQLGYKESRNYIIEARYADTDRNLLPGLAKELVDHGVDIIVTVGTPPTRAAKNATSTVPIVMAGSNNPVANGLVASLARPGGNVTGLVHSPGPEFSGKGLQLLREAVPLSSRIAVLTADPDRNLDILNSAAGSMGITLLFHDLQKVKGAGDFNNILTAIIEGRADAVFAFPDFIIAKYQQTLIDFLNRNNLPSMFQDSWAVRRGALLSYYTDFNELRRKAAAYVDKIIRGANPADLPVEQPTKFELVINLKTAEAIGLTVPQSLLIHADEVIE